MPEERSGVSPGTSQRPRPAGPAGGGAPTDAFLSLAETLTKRAKEADAGRADERVVAAFALGWQMAEVYRPDRGRRSTPAEDDDLPGISDLTVGELEEMGLDQIQAGITKLADPILWAGLYLPDAQRFEEYLSGIHDGNERKRAIREFHVDLLSTLTAADYRLGKAYGLGRALADTTRHPLDYRKELGEYRIATLASWTRELASVFGPHAARPVAQSLEAWSRSVNGAGADNEDAPKQLAAQGRLWRSLLSGEKRATEVLETSDYLRAAERTLQRSAALSMRFVKHYWWLLAIVVVLFVVGFVVIVTASGAAAIVAGAGPLLASFGLSWVGVGSALGAATERLGEPVWQAELDTVIYERITPQGILRSQGTVVATPEEPSLSVRERDPEPAPVTPPADENPTIVVPPSEQ